MPAHIIETDDITPTLPEPVEAFVLHQDRTFGGPTSLVTRHPIIEHQGQPLLGAGSLTSDDDLLVLGDVLREGASRRVYGGSGGLSLLSPDVLGLGPDYLVWRIPAAVRPMWFRVAANRVFDLSVPWPPLVACASPQGLYVAAIKPGRRPASSTKLFHAPLMNVDGAGSVCTGTAQVPESYRPDKIDAWNAVLFDSAFSHVNHFGTLAAKGRVENRAHMRFWQGLHDENALRFPTDALRPMQTTLGQWLEAR